MHITLVLIAMHHECLPTMNSMAKCSVLKFNSVFFSYTYVYNANYFRKKIIIFTLILFSGKITKSLEKCGVYICLYHIKQKLFCFFGLVLKVTRAFLKHSCTVCNVAN